MNNEGGSYPPAKVIGSRQRSFKSFHSTRRFMAWLKCLRKEPLSIQKRALWKMFRMNFIWVKGAFSISTGNCQSFTTKTQHERKGSSHLHPTKVWIKIHRTDFCSRRLKPLCWLSSYPKQIKTNEIGKEKYFPKFDHLKSDLCLSFNFPKHNCFSFYCRLNKSLSRSIIFQTANSCLALLQWRWLVLQEED